ncbi:MAG TPA: hypothetical protein VEY67_07285, partial [Candidatus Dormibacteraeota bacterium]|nr:hypothetical protein [Candidatus Dormibacteraeota bacterium]
MSAIDGRSLPAGSDRAARSRWRMPMAIADAARDPERLVFSLPLAAALVGLVVALLSLLVNATDPVMAPLLAALGVLLDVAAVLGRARTRSFDRPALGLATLCLVAA